LAGVGTLPEADNDAELKRLALENAKVDLDLKKASLRDRPSLLKTGLSNPIVIGGVLTAIVALCTTWVSTIVARQQVDAQLRVESMKLESNLILKAVETDDPEQLRQRLLFLIASGLLRDRTSGRISSYLQKTPSEQGTSIAPDTGPSP
jgi:hypothetical protein